MLNTLQTAYNGHKTSEKFLYAYEEYDIAAVKLSTDSANIWSISPPDRKRMLAEVNSSKLLASHILFDIQLKSVKIVFIYSDLYSVIM